MEKAVCSNAVLSQLDDDLARAYTQARATKGVNADALVRDGQNWIADRDELAREMLGDSFLKGTANFHEAIARVYRERIDFLEGLSGRGATLSPQTRVLQQALKVSDMPTGKTTVLSVLAAHDATILPAENHEGATQPASLSLALFSAEPTPDLLQALKELPRGEWFGEWWLPTVHIGNLYGMAGTAHCLFQTLFVVENGAARLIKTPDVLTSACEWVSAEMGLIAGRPVAVRTSFGGYSSEHAIDISVQVWQDDRWSNPTRLLVRYDQQLELGAAACASGDCATANATAFSYARRFARHPLAGTLDLPLTGSGHADLRANAQARRSGQERCELPAVRRIAADRHVRLRRGRHVFSARLNGELVLARIGHGHFGWRESEPWLVGFWRLQSGRLSPVAGVTVGVKRADYLLSAPMTAISGYQ